MHQPTTSEYILPFCGGLDAGLRPADVQQFMEQCMAWAERLTQQGKLQAGHPLGDQRRMVPAWTMAFTSRSVAISGRGSKSSVMSRFIRFGPENN